MRPGQDRARFFLADERVVVPPRTRERARPENEPPEIADPGAGPHGRPRAGETDDPRPLRPDGIRGPGTPRVPPLPGDDPQIDRPGAPRMTLASPIVREGHATVHGYRLYWKSVGEPGPLGTVVVLHGGPGGTHDYLIPFADLARAGARVVFYDQIGCGRSALARATAEYTIDRDVEDLEELRRKLRLGRIHLIGSSYGGLLALAYALAHPEPLRSLVSASGLASVPLTVREMNRLKSELPARVRSALERHEARGEFEDPEYLAAVQVFYRRHLCRLPTWPAEVAYTMSHLSAPKYGTMNGPNEFTITGTIRNYDVTDRLHEIRGPTLVTAGRYDEVTPVVARSIHDHVPGSEFTLFPKSSHVAFWEERRPYLETVRKFLARCS